MRDRQGIDSACRAFHPLSNLCPSCVETEKRLVTTKERSALDEWLQLVELPPPFRVSALAVLRQKSALK